MSLFVICDEFLSFKAINFFVYCKNLSFNKKIIEKTTKSRLIQINDLIDKVNQI